jgi:DNA-binding GntR family transcriptional regulator
MWPGKPPPCDAGDAPGRTELLGDFHVRMAELMGNEVLAQMLGELISRCALITLMYQSASAAEHSTKSTPRSCKALAPRRRAGRALMDEHLLHVEKACLRPHRSHQRHLAGPV